MQAIGSQERVREGREGEVTVPPPRYLSAIVHYRQSLLGLVAEVSEGLEGSPPHGGVTLGRDEGVLIGVGEHH